MSGFFHQPCSVSFHVKYVFDPIWGADRRIYMIHFQGEVGCITNVSTSGIKEQIRLKTAINVGQRDPSGTGKKDQLRA